MREATRTISFLLIVLLLDCCATSKETYYSYRTTTYTVDTVKTPLYDEHLISYDNYLFEFKKRTNIRTAIYGDSSGPTSVDYDTLGVYLLSSSNKLFYEFDTFALKNKVVKIGRLEDKPFGQKINFHANGFSDDLSLTPLKKVLINNIPCFVTGVIPNGKTGNDSINENILLIKNPKFNSHYKINGVKFTNSNYCIIGFQIYDLKQKQSALQEIESMRPLTEKEKAICANMIRKSKLGVVDTTNTPFSGRR